MSYFTQIGYSDTGSLDAFTRLRTSSPETLFSTQSQYSTAALQMEVGATGTGVTPTWSSSTRMVTVSATAGSGTSFTQSYNYLPYEPGKSQFIAATFVLGTAVAGATVDVGYFDANNGVILRQNGATNYQLILRTATSGSPSDSNIVNQSAWNIDTMLSGTGPSGLTIDFAKAQIMVIDLQFLGMGRVRVGFDINGSIFYVHQFLNANVLAVPYMQSATLPVGMLVTATATAGTKTALWKCATVQAEGGNLDQYGFDFVTPEVVVTAGSGARTTALGIRPKTTYGGVPNRELFLPEYLNIMVTGASTVLWELVIGATSSGQTFADVNTTYSAFEYTSVPGTFTNLTGGVVIDSGYCGQTGGGAGGVSTVQKIPIAGKYGTRYPISLDRAGAVRALGTLTVLLTGIGGASATRLSVGYHEIR